MVADIVAAVGEKRTEQADILEGDEGNSSSGFWSCATDSVSDRRQFGGQRIGPLRDRPGAEADDIVAGLRHRRDQSGQFLGAVERDDLPVPMVAQPLHEGVAIGQLGVQMPNPTGKGLKPNKPGERRGGRQV